MKHGAVRKLTRAAALSLLVLTTTAGVASWGVLAASPAMAAEEAGSGSGGQGNGSDPGSTPPAKDGNPATALLGSVLGGSGSSLP